MKQEIPHGEMAGTENNRNIEIADRKKNIKLKGRKYEKQGVYFD